MESSAAIAPHTSQPGNHTHGIVLSRRQRNALLLAAAISSGCGLAAELLLGTLASYLDRRAPAINSTTLLRLHAFNLPYQRIILTRCDQDVRLFLDGDLQFSTLNEYGYSRSPRLSHHER